MMMKYNENGRSMVEMLGVLAIIGVLSVGGIAGYSKAMNKYKINKTTDQVSMLVANIRTLFSSQGNYKDLTNAQAIKFGVVPNDMYTPTLGNAEITEIKNAFNGQVYIAASGGRADGDNEAFVIVYSGLSSEACVTIATGDWGSGQASGLIAIGAAGKKATAVDSEGSAGGVIKSIFTTTADGNDNVSIPGAKTLNHRTPMTVSKAVGICNGSGSTNSVAWKYY